MTKLVPALRAKLQAQPPADPSPAALAAQAFPATTRTPKAASPTPEASTPAVQHQKTPAVSADPAR